MAIAVLTGHDDEFGDAQPIRAFVGEDAEGRAKEYAAEIEGTFYDIVLEVFDDAGGYQGGDLLYSEDDGVSDGDDDGDDWDSDLDDSELEFDDAGDEEE